jgi:hypothetical protein
MQAINTAAASAFIECCIGIPQIDACSETEEMAMRCSPHLTHPYGWWATLFIN